MATKPSAPLGQILLKQKLITPAQLDDALSEQLVCQSRLGDILVANGSIGMLSLYQAIAAHYELEFINLHLSPPDEQLMKREHLPDYIRLLCLPWKKDGKKTILATCEPTDELRAFAKKQYGTYELVITSPYDIRSVIEQHFADRLDAISRMRLYKELPAFSARHTFFPSQRTAFIFLLLILWVFALLLPSNTGMFVVGILHLIYGSTMLFKWLVFLIGRRYGEQHHETFTDAELPDDATLPVYTVLVPLYHEAESLPHLLNSLDALDYPTSKLDIKLILEEDDEETYEAAKALSPPRHIEIIRVPYSEPRTKPKACNYALHFARGDYVTIYDAEDEPDSLQLKKAVRAFRELPDEVVCLQARLNYYNAPATLLTQWFALEYGILFRALLPGLQQLAIPIPLGGTSNHLSLTHLRELGEWDPFNVTEDADLGIRLASRGYKTAVLDSVTMEEAPVKVGSWINQRSRWIKGYMQTWLVHMRNPGELLENLGLASFLGFQFFVGLSCLVYLSAPIVWTLSILALVWPEHLAGIFLAELFIPVMIFNLGLHFVAHWAQSAVVLKSLKSYPKYRRDYILAVISYPAYFVLHSLASYKALWQLFSRPHFWEKTAHGHGRRRLKQVNHRVDRPVEAL